MRLGGRGLAVAALAMCVAGAARAQSPSEVALLRDSCGAGPIRIDTIIDTLFAWIPARSRAVPEAEHAFLTAQVRAVLAQIPALPVLTSVNREIGTAPIPEATTAETRAVYLAWFQVRNDGKLVGLRVRRQSGWLALDSALGRAILRADSQHTLLPLTGELTNQGINLWLSVGGGRLENHENIAVARFRRIRQTVEGEVPARLLRVGHYPQFPPLAVAAGVGDSMIFEFVIDTTGRVIRESIRPVRASYREFAEEAVRAIMSANFAPARIGRCKIRTRVQQSVNFRIR